MTRPLQIYIEEGDLARLERWSRRRGWTKSQAVRVAIRALTKEGQADPLLDASGMIEGLPADVSRNFESYLEGTYVVPKAPARRRPKRTNARVRR
jgi:hypothetical protein